MPTPSPLRTGHRHRRVCEDAKNGPGAKFSPMVKLYPSMLKVALLHFLKPSFFWLASVMARASGVPAEPVPSLHCTVTADPRWLRAAQGGCTHLDLGANNQGSLCSPYAPATAPSPTGCSCDGRGLERLRGCVWLWAGPGCRAPSRFALWRLGEVGRPRGNGGDWRSCFF